MSGGTSCAKPGAKRSMRGAAFVATTLTYVVVAAADDLLRSFRASEPVRAMREWWPPRDAAGSGITAACLRYSSVPGSLQME
jgi:hypothetical protein